MYEYYIIEEGDTLDSIANKLMISKEVIMELNGSDMNFNQGNILVVPKSVSKYFDYYKVVKGDTLYKIASDNKIDANLLAVLNGINLNDYIYPNQTLLIPKAGSSLYITAVGDTLGEVAQGFNVSTNELISQNEKIYLQPEQLIVYKYR